MGGYRSAPSEGEKSVTYYSEEDKPNKQVESMLVGQKVHLNFGLWNEKNLTGVCENIQEWKAEQLLLGVNYEKTLLRQIGHIRFSRLSRMSLRNNSIESIEALHMVEMPELRELLMGQNHVICSDAVGKCHWPKLCLLDISNTLILDIRPLTKTYLPNELNHLGIEWPDHHFRHCPPTSTLLKLQAPFIRELRTFTWSKHRFVKSIADKNPSNQTTTPAQIS